MAPGSPPPSPGPATPGSTSVAARGWAPSPSPAWGWTSAATLGLIGASVVLLAVFLRIERRVERPMLDLSLFARAAFAGATASAVINYVCVYGILFLVPFYLIEGRGLGPARAGLLLTSQPLVMMFVAPNSCAMQVCSKGSRALPVRAA